MVLAGGIFFGYSLFPQYTFKPLNANYNEIYNIANQQRRLKATEKLFAQPKTTSRTYLPNKPFGGMNMFGTIIRPEPRFNRAQVMSLVDKNYPSVDFEIQEQKIKINRRDYSFFLFEFNNKKYWHVFGNIVPYRFGASDQEKILQYAKENFPDRELPPGFTIELDHVIPRPFADAMGISRDAGTAVFVPAFSNAVRTNSKEWVDDFTNFDWRLSVDERQYPLSIDFFVKQRLKQAINRTFVMHVNENSQHVKNLKKK